MSKFVKILLCSLTLITIFCHFYSVTKQNNAVTVFADNNEIQEIDVYLWTENLTSENFLRYFSYFKDKNILIKQMYPNYNNEIKEEYKIVIEKMNLIEAINDFVNKYNNLNNSSDDTIIRIKAIKIRAFKNDIENFLKNNKQILYSYNEQGPYKKQP